MRPSFAKAKSTRKFYLTAAAPTEADTAGRRQLTVMFCDLVGSTALSAKLDPEVLHGVIGAYHRCCTKLVEGNGGFVAKYMGNRVLAYFGYPKAHEDDAERAVRTGLAVARRAAQSLPFSASDRSPSIPFARPT